jgi:hypothetical protein
MKITILTACLLAFLFTFSTPAAGATYTVNLTTDEHDANPGDGVCAIAGGGCSLRAGVEEGNRSFDDFYNQGTSITFNLPQYSTITLTAANGGEIVSLHRIAILGSGSFYLTIDGGAGTNRIFNFTGCRGCIYGGQQNAQISDVTLTGGNGSGLNGGVGGAILAGQDTQLQLSRVHIYGNSADRGGGVVFQGLGGLIKDSTISGNWSNDCGGVYNESQSGTLEIVNSTISGNTAYNSGGGLCNGGDTKLRNVTITGNTSRYTNDGTNSTTKGGGGILQEISFYRSSSTLNLGNTIVAGNFGRDGYLNPTEIQFASGTITSAGGNLIGDSAGDSAYTGANAVVYHPTDIRDVNPMLNTLRYELGYTPTQSLLAGSPAIDKGINSLAVYGYNNTLRYDQRGYGDFPRIRDGNGDGTATVDIGAIEFQPGQTYSTPTAAGQNVTVAPTSNLNLTFSSVTTAGNTTVIALTERQLSPLPSNYLLTSSSLMYDITTSAVYSGNITVTLNQPNVADATACSRLRILHYTNNAWDDSVNAAPSYDSATRICTVSQTVTSLSPFVVVQININSYTISGQVSNSGTALSGVSIALSGSLTGTATTDSTGNYSFTVNGGGSYTVTPSLANYTFTPPASTFNNVTANQTANFAGTSTTTAPVNISGTVSYGTTPSGQAAKFVPGVSVNATGTSSVSALSSSTGDYSLANLIAGGNYLVTPAKSGNVNGISSFDASLVARKAANTVTLTPNQMIAADASNNGAVSSFDASLIARTAAGIANTGIAGQWKFAPSSRSYQGLTASQTGQNYDAILLGEVSGNWLAPSGGTTAGSPSAEEAAQSDRQEEEHYQFKGFDSFPVPDQANSQSKVTAAAAAQQVTVAVSLPANATASNGTTVIIPVTVGDTTGAGIFSFDFTVTFDPNVLQLASPAFDTTGTVAGAAGFTITPNAGTGQLTISGFGSQALSGAGTLINLRFTVVGTSGTATGSTNLTFTSFMFNEGDPAAQATNGRFSVTGATAASVSVAGRVTARGRGISNAVVRLTNQSGEIQTVRTNRLGYYTFRELAAGETYIFNVFSKRYQFDPKVINLTEDLAEVDFTAQ